MDATIAMTTIGILGLLLLKMSLNILTPRQWTMQQALSDAYLTYEKAYAQRVPFEELTSGSSPWPAQPQSASSQVEIGKAPGGRALTGTIYRTRIPDEGNFAMDGGTGTTTSNPAAMKVWKLQSILKYQVGDRTYVKSRTVVRSQ